MSGQWRGPGWLRPGGKRFGWDWFERTTSVELTGTAVTDRVVPHLLKLRYLQQLRLGPATKVSAEQVARLREALPDCAIEVGPLS